MKFYSRGNNETYKLGYLPKYKQQNNARLHYLLKEDLTKLDKFTDEIRLLGRNNISTTEQLLECGFCGHKLSRRTRHQTTSTVKPVWQCMNATKNGIANCLNCKSIDEVIIENKKAG